MFVWIFTTVLLVSNGARAGYITPCTATDKACLLTTANSVYQQLMKGIPELDIKPNEPAHLPLVDAEIAGLKYKFTNAIISGMDKCKISSIDYNPDTLKIRAQVSCPQIVIDSPYETSGSLMMIPVHGKGECLFVTGEYNFDYDCSAKISESVGKRYLSVRTCRLVVNAVGPISFDIDNLFDGNKELSDAFHDFLHTNWKEVHDILKDPVWEVHTKILLSKLNMVLRTYALN